MTLDKLFAYFNFENIANVSSVVSILSFFMSIVTLYLVFTLRRRFIFRISIDKNKNSLNKSSTEISSLLNDFVNNKDGISDKLKIIEITLRNISKGSSNKDLSKDIKITMKKISNYKNTEKEIREIKTDVVGIIEELKYEKQNIEVGR